MNEYVVSRLKELDEKITRTGTVSKSDILSLEEYCDATLFSSAGIVKYLTEIPSANGVIEVKKILNNQLENYTSSHIGTYQYLDSIISDIVLIKRKLINFVKILSCTPIVTNEIVNIFLDTRYTLDYDENQNISEITKDADVILALNSYNYISRLLETLYGDVNIVNNKLEKHNMLIGIISQTSLQEDYLGNMPMLNKLMLISKLEKDKFSPTETCIESTRYENITVANVLTLLQNISNVIKNINNYISDITRIFSIKSISDVHHDALDYNLIYKRIRLGVSSLIEPSFLDIVVYMIFVNLLTNDSKLINDFHILTNNVLDKDSRNLFIKIPKW